MLNSTTRKIARWFGFIPIEDVAVYAEMDTLFIALGVTDEERTQAIRAASVLAKAGTIPAEEAAIAFARAMVTVTPSLSEVLASWEDHRRRGASAGEASRD